MPTREPEAQANAELKDVGAKPPPRDVGPKPPPRDVGPKAAPTRAKRVEETITLPEFLETRPPGSSALIGDAITGEIRGDGGTGFSTPDIRLHCASEDCSGIRAFQCQRDSGAHTIYEGWSLRFLTYLCRNCQSSSRIFALRNRWNKPNVEMQKIGEAPPFGPPVPPRVISLIGPDRDLFLKGRRAENQGLGIGSFAYYRRAVDDQWQRLLGEIIRVAETTGAPAPMTATLKAAAKETQFSKAVEMIKEGIPDVLKVRGHNPLTLLYAALSEGLHDGTDEHCLGLANSVRVVLTELAERIGLALKDEQELAAAVTNLLTKRAPSKQGDNS
jgi:hypothetical protein